MQHCLKGWAGNTKPTSRTQLQGSPLLSATVLSSHKLHPGPLLESGWLYCHGSSNYKWGSHYSLSGGLGAGCPPPLHLGLINHDTQRSTVPKTHLCPSSPVGLHSGLTPHERQLHIFSLLFLCLNGLFSPGPLRCYFLSTITSPTFPLILSLLQLWSSFGPWDFCSIFSSEFLCSLHHLWCSSFCPPRAIIPTLLHASWGLAWHLQI